MVKNMKERRMAEKIAHLVQECGGKTYYVGGSVRDKLLGLDVKDIDIEIHGVDMDKVISILDSLGKRKVVGESFGIFMLKGYDLDISIPRKEEKRGILHQDFDISVDPYIGTYKAALRRDFTINALMEDVITGEIIDHFGGINDLNNKVIRHVNDLTFTEDSLRVLRACQFASRFGFVIADETLELCKKIDITNLPKERIEGELKKALLKGIKPSIFFDYLYEIGSANSWFKELYDLKDVPQNPVYHAEGNAYNHTMLVIDNGIKYLNEVKEPYLFMLSCLCHDFGKINATMIENGVIKSINHENMGDDLIKSFLNRFTNEKKIFRYVLNMARLHMRPARYACDNSSIKATNKMFDESICPNDLIMLSYVDGLGQKTDLEKKDHRPFLFERLSVYEELMNIPQVTGKDLIDLKLKPRRFYREALEYAHNLHLSGVKKEDAIKQVVNYFIKIKEDYRKSNINML